MTSSRPSVLALTRSGPLRLFDTTELLRLPPPTWLVQDILPTGGLVGLYGQPRAAKSFLAIDLALCVATGHAWHGHVVQPDCFVLYVSAEGGTGIGKRVQAWLSSHEVSASTPQMAWLTQSIPVSSTSDDMDVLFRRLDSEVERNPALVIIDTLARCLEGDENLQEDMGRFIAGVDRLRREFNATVVVVHHTRLDAERERGSTAFRGAADTMILSVRHNETDVTFSCNKQKDAKEFDAIEFKLRVVPVTIAGLADTTCLMESAYLGAKTAILARLQVEPCSFNDFLRSHVHIPKTSLRRALLALRETGEITKENGIYRLVRGQEK